MSFDVSGFVAGETVVLNQCRTDPPACAGFYVEELRANEAGNVAGDYSPQQWIFSQDGWVDCMREPCVLQLHGTSSQVIRTVPVDVSDRAPLAKPSPTMTLQPSGPYTEGQAITINITGVPPGVDGTLSICTKVRPDASQSGHCVVPSAGFFTTGTEGSVTLTSYRLPAHPCRSPDPCELAWDPGYDFPTLVAQDIDY